MSQAGDKPQNDFSIISFSVVVNTCDRAGPLRRLLYALNRQTYRNFEVVVVVGPTRDNTLEMLEAFADRLKVISCPDFNLSVSRNLGIAAAGGDVVAFIDDDAIPCPTWLAQLAEAFADPSLGSAGGKVYEVYPQSGRLQFAYGVFSALADDVDVRAGPHQPLPAAVPPARWFPRLMGANMAFRRQALLDVGGFDQRFAYLFEEPDIAIRLSLRNYPTRHLPEAVVYHAPASGRNREIFTWRINWYAWMRGIIYFTLKNGRPIAGLRHSLARSVQHCLRFFSNVSEYRKAGSLPAAYYPDVRRQLWRGIAWGFWYGLLMPRQLSGRPVQAQQFLPFPVKNSGPQYPVAPFTEINPQVLEPMLRAPLSVCLVSLNYPPEKTDGVARSTHTLALGLAELGHEVHVIKAGVADRVTWYDGAYVHEVRAKGNRYAAYRRQGYHLTHTWLNASHAVFENVRSLITNHNIQIVDSPLYQAEGLVTGVAGVAPVVVRLVTGLRQIAEMTGQVNPDTQLAGELEARLLRLSSGIIANTRATYRAVSGVYNLDFDTLGIPTAVVYYGLKPAPESDVSPVDVSSREKPIILYVGRLEKRKGILDLFAAVPRVLRQFPGAQFWLAGKDNSDQDGFRGRHGLDYRQYFERKFAPYLPGVRFLGYVPDDKLSRLYQSCDLFVAPSLYESFGLIYLEAMNYARPVIGCNAGGPAEIIEEGLTGFLVEPQQPGQLAEKIITLLADRTQLREMGLAGRQRLVERFSHLAMAENFAQFYRAVLEQRKVIPQVR